MTTLILKKKSPKTLYLERKKARRINIRNVA